MAYRGVGEVGPRQGRQPLGGAEIIDWLNKCIIKELIQLTEKFYFNSQGRNLELLLVCLQMYCV